MAIVVIGSDGWDSEPPEQLAAGDGPAAPACAPGGLDQPPGRRAGLRAAGGDHGGRAAVLRRLLPADTFARSPPWSPSSGATSAGAAPRGRAAQLQSVTCTDGLKWLMFTPGAAQHRLGRPRRTDEPGQLVDRGRPPARGRVSALHTPSACRPGPDSRTRRPSATSRATTNESPSETPLPRCVSSSAAARSGRSAGGSPAPGSGAASSASAHVRGGGGRAEHPGLLAQLVDRRGAPPGQRVTGSHHDDELVLEERRAGQARLGVRRHRPDRHVDRAGQQQGAEAGPAQRR